MKDQRKKKIIAIIVIVVLIVLFAPFPQHISRSLHGVVERNGKQSEVTAELSAWSFDFLLFGRKFSGGLTIHEGKNTVAWDIMNQYTFSDAAGRYQSYTFTRYDADSNAGTWLEGIGNEDVSMLLLTEVNSVNSGTYCLAAGDKTIEDMAGFIDRWKR